MASRKFIKPAKSDQDLRWARIWFRQLAVFHKRANDPAWNFTPEELIAFLQSKRDQGFPAWKRMGIMKTLGLKSLADFDLVQGSHVEAHLTDQCMSPLRGFAIALEHLATGLHPWLQHTVPSGLTCSRPGATWEPKTWKTTAPCWFQSQGLDPRVAHSISRVRKTAVGDPRQHAKAGLCLAGGGGMSRREAAAKWQSECTATKWRQVVAMGASPMPLPLWLVWG